MHDETHLTTAFGGREWAIEQFFHDGHVAAVTAGADDVVWTVVEPERNGT